MKDVKRSSGLTFFAVIISVFYAVEHIEEYLLQFINCYFFIALAYLMIGCFMYVLDSGFFRNFTSAYRKLIKASFSNPSYSDDEIIKNPGTNSLYTWPLIWSGLAGLVITLFISLTFF
ncbi:MAG: hypothetical protein K0R71_918 [Bacillales bacterium]|jgi:hypothetical protein|nr:hypothetical protein [Bacillales bacterium]